jgi:putative Mg2+ transporter-C (MgtC) family protein
MILLTTELPAHASWYGNLHEVLAYPWVVIVLVLAAAICGSIVGMERKSRRKPVGMRTITLICMGSAIFTIVSVFISRAEGADPGRIAAQVVTGIGFLGAGTILHSQERVRGLTTAATIWVVAAIGVLIGAGYAVPAIMLSVFVVGLLRLHTESEYWAAKRRQGKPSEEGE